MKRKKGMAFVLSGLVLILAALFMTGYNFYQDYQADKAASDVLESLEEQIPQGELIPDYVMNPDMEMPKREIDGWLYIGVLRIDSLGISLPVASEWNESAAYISPCRYTGSAYKDDMIICAHNFLSHFRQLGDIQPEDEIIFTDMAGNRFVYHAVSIETLEPTAVEEMQSGEWDLTLFTCTLGGQSRVTLRCERIIQ